MKNLALILAFLVMAVLSFTVESALIDKQIKKAFPKHCKFKITSGFRTKKRNRKVGGAPNSFHLTNRARDIIISPIKCRTLAELSLLKSGLTIIQYPVHTHIDNRKTQKCLRVTKSGFKLCTLDSTKYFKSLSNIGTLTE